MAGAFLASCSNDDDTITVPLGDYENGMFILNEGGFNVGNASVSFLTNDFVLENNVVNIVNGVDLGDVAQSMAFNGDRAYIVINNSHKIEVVNRYTFEHVATISVGLDNPRYIAVVDNKAYVTNWGDGMSADDDFVAVIDLSSNTVVEEIVVTEGPETIIEEGGKIYVAHEGGFNFGNAVSVIDPATNAITATVAVGDTPNSMEAENGRLYVMAGGKPSWAGTETSGSLTIINLANNAVEDVVEFGSVMHPSNLKIEDNTIYFTIDAGIYNLSTTASSFPDAPLFETTDQGVYGVYSFEVENGNIYVGDAVDYSANGKVYIYSLSGNLQHSFTVGVIPTGFYFND